MAIARYNGIEQDDEGVYVLYEDHLAALATERERCARIAAGWCDISPNHDPSFRRLFAEIANALRAGGQP